MQMDSFKMGQKHEEMYLWNMYCAGIFPKHRLVRREEEKCGKILIEIYTGLISAIIHATVWGG